MMATHYDIDTELELSGSGNFLTSGFDHEEIHKRMEELDERLSCAVCLSRFSEPRLLDCNHSFCKHCLEDILAKRAMDLDHPIGEDELICPRCRKITRLGGGGIETLPRNFDLEAVATVMPPERDLSTPVKHKVQGFVRQQSAPTCSQHNKELAYYCKTDGNLLCGDCLVETDHKNHDTGHANKVGDAQKDTFQNNSFESLEKEFQNFSLAIKNVSYVSSSLRQKGEQTKGEIQEHFQSLRENLVKTEQELLSGTDKIISEKVAALGEQEKQLKEMHEELDFEFQHAQKVLESPSITFLHAQKNLTAKVQHIVKKAQQVDRTPVEIVSQGPYWHHPSRVSTDSTQTSGVFCDPTPSMYTAFGVGLKKAFVQVEASFKVEARDKYGNRSFLKGTDPRVIIIGPGKSGQLSYTIDASVGEYVIRYIPKEVGFHFLTITVCEESIQNSEHRVTVFNAKDYLGLSKPLKSIHKSQLQTEPPVSTMRGVCALSNGWIIFTDAFCLRVVDGKTGALRQTIGSYGNAPSQFNTPLGIAVNFQNNIFVTDSSNHRVQRFQMEPNGRFRFVSLFGAQGNSKQCLQNPEGIAVLGDEKVFVADKGNNRIQVLLQRNMKHSTSFGKKGKRPGQFNVPRDVTVNTYFNCLLVSDAENKRIQALTFDGKPLMTFGGHSSICFETPPCFIAVDKDGFILITNTTFQVMTILTPLGEYVRQFGYKDGSSRNFKTPYGICADDQGMIIITDSTSNCIHFF